MHSSQRARLQAFARAATADLSLGSLPVESWLATHIVLRDGWCAAAMQYWTLQQREVHDFDLLMSTPYVSNPVLFVRLQE